jgi:hypothetical protein
MRNVRTVEKLTNKVTFVTCFLLLKYVAQTMKQKLMKIRPLYPQGKNSWYPLDRSLGGSRAVLDAVVKKKILSPLRESNPRTPIVQPVAQKNSLNINN